MADQKDRIQPLALPDNQPLGSFDAQEQQEIAQEIESIISGSMVRDEASLAAFRPRKKGIFFVLTVNSVLATLVAGFILLSQWYFTGRIEAQREESSRRFSNEGLLVAKLLENSRKQLEAKNQEIQSIQQEMERLNTEKSTLAANFDNQVAQRESALKAQLAQELEAERARLRAQGISENDIAQRLAALEKTKAQEFDAALAKFRQESQAQLESRTRELADLQSRLSRAQEEENQARLALAKAAEDREAALKTQISDQTRALERLNREREIQSQFTRQVDGALQDVRSKVAELDFRGAEAGLTALDVYLRGVTAETTGFTADQARTLQTLSGSLRTALQEAGNRSLLAADPRYESFKVQAQEALNTTGNAREQALLKAAGEIPEVWGIVTALGSLRQGAETTAREAQVRQLLTASAALAPEEGLRVLLRGLTPEAVRSTADQVLTRSLEGLRAPALENQNLLTRELDEVRALQAELTRQNQDLQTRLSAASAELEAARLALAEKPGVDPAALAQLDEMKKTSEQLYARLAVLEEQQVGLSEENTALTAERDRLQGLLTESEKTVEALKAAAADPEALQTALAEASKLQTALEEALRENQKLTVTLEEGQAETEKLRTDLAQLQVQSREWEKFAAAYVTLVPELLALAEASETAAVEAGRNRLAKVFQSQEGVRLFPNFPEVLESLAEAQRKVAEKARGAAQPQIVEKVVEVPADPLPIREKAFDEVLTATRYLAGASPTAGLDQKSLEQLSREDPKFRKVVESIQELSRKGITESALKTAEFTLFGPLVSFSGSRGVVEALSSVAPEEGQAVQIRMPGRNGETLAAGKVTAVKGKRVDIEVTQRVEGKAPPASGQVVFLEVR